jgi:chemotaxis protein histidine kinase CheA
MMSSNLAKRNVLTAALLCAVFGPPAGALEPGSGSRSDRTDRIDNNAQRDLDRAQQRAAEDAARTRADADERAAKDAEDRAKDAADAEERAAKEAADAAEDAAKEAEDAAKDAADAAEDAAEAAEDNRGSSESMRDLAEAENPEQDDRGFPVRRGEIVALDMSDAALASAKAQGFTVIERTPLAALDSVVTRLATPKDMDAQAALATMRSLDAKGSYDLTHYYATAFIPQGSRSAAAPRATAPAAKGSLKIGMIDTKVADHKWLSNISLQQRDFTKAKEGGPTEHGTAIASLLSADGAGSIYAASIFQGSAAKPYTSADTLVRALNWMVEQNVVVINISLSGPRNTILDTLVARTIAKGHIIVAAAGNGGPTAPPAYPAALPDVVAVTAVDRKMKVYRYANQGRYITVAARGVDVTAAAPGGGSSSYSGTSFATPHIAAFMARCTKSLSAAARKKCMASLEKSAKDLGAPGKDAVYGLGYIG